MTDVVTKEQIFVIQRTVGLKVVNALRYLLENNCEPEINKASANKINMAIVGKCILRQLYTDEDDKFNRARRLFLHNEHKDAFYAPDELDDEEVGHYYTLLTYYWREAIVEWQKYLD